MGVSYPLAKSQREPLYRISRPFFVRLVLPAEIAVLEDSFALLGFFTPGLQAQSLARLIVFPGRASKVPCHKPNSPFWQPGPPS